MEEAGKPENTIPCFTAGKTDALNKIGFILLKKHYIEAT